MFFHVRLYDYPVSRRTPELRTQHRQYLAEHASHLIARGAVQGDEGSGPRGSLFFMDFADRAAVEHFIFNEPNYRAGVYMSAEIFRWSNVLERKPGEYTGLEGEGLWYFRGYAKPGRDAEREKLFKQHGAYLDLHRPSIVVRGGLFDTEDKWVGSAMILKLADRKAADAFAAEEPFCRNGLFERISVERCGLAGPDHK